jgi:hypothetical protein
MTEDQQREFASVQILLKRRNTDVPKLPFLDDIRSWKDIGVSAFEYLPSPPQKKKQNKTKNNAIIDFIYCNVI